jgi:SPP1 gp7 family putative phage head morphogenesis protein
MTVARLQRTINDFRSRLMQHEASAVASLEDAYGAVLVAIRPELDALYQQITDKLNAGEAIPPSWLYERLRLENLTLLIQGQIDQYGSMALMHTRQLQHFGVNLGMQAAVQLLDAIKPVGINWTWGTPSSVAIERLVGATQAGSPLADLFAGFGQEAATLVSHVLVAGVSLGAGPRELAPQVQRALGVSRNRALTITRDVSLNSYRGANLETFRANRDVVTKYRRTAALSPRTCAVCIALDGTIYDLDEDFAIHPNDRCVPVPITRPWSEILAPLGIDTSHIPETNPAHSLPTGADWFAKQPEKVQRVVLGNGKYEAWKAGKFQLSDVVKRTFNKDWGHSIQEKSLKALVK